MAEVTKYISAGKFDPNAANDKKIVAIMQGEGQEASVKKAGIVKKTAGGYSMTIDEKEYLFTASGTPASPNAVEEELYLNMAETQQTPISDAIANNAGVVYNRTVDSETGDVSYQPVPNATDNIDIDNLNARDQFAIQILRSLLDKVNDPSKLNTTEVAYYCDTAYTWAGYMMKESSQARAVIKDTGADPTAIEEVPVKYLADNTEKLLNNIAAALDKTNAEITVGQQTDLKAERITIPELNKLIENLKTLQENYVKDGNTTVGLKDLIAAIGNINFTNLISAITNMSTVRTANIGSNGLGNSANNPIYINSVGTSGWPSARSLNRITSTYLDGFVAFDTSDNTGYFTVLDLFDIVTASATFRDAVDTRIKAWLNATTIVADGSGWKLNVPSSI